MESERFTVSIVDVDVGESKTFIDFEISDEFQEWFVKNHCPSKKFNQKTFKGWMQRALYLALVTLDKGKYEKIYCRMYGREEGVCRPQEGDIVVFFRDGYRTRMVSSVNNRTVELEKLYEGDTYRRTSYGDIFEITRPRSV